MQGRRGLRQLGDGIADGIRAGIGEAQARLYSAGALSIRSAAVPDFLGIGAQKAGTTWLYENLKCHPEVFLPETKELHYFDRHFHHSLRSYLREFEPGAGRVKGEITPAYAALPRSRVRYIHRLMPKARLILLLRNPVERAWSQALMNLVIREKRPVETIADEEFVAHFQDERSIKRGDYLGQIDRWLSVYPAEQLYVGFFEDVRERPRELLSDVFRHIGVSLDVDWSAFPFNEVVHKGVGTPMPERQRAFLQAMYAGEIDRLVARFGDRIAHWRA